MSGKAQVIIKDACVLFDLIDLGILHLFYQLDLTVYTTIAVIGEITNESQLKQVTLYIESGKLIVDGFGSMTVITELIKTNKGLSFVDGSVLELAFRLTGVVLSSDKSLRNELTRRGLEVRGVLWVILELERNGLIKPVEAVVILKKYPEINCRAPLVEIEKLIRTFE